MDSDMTMTTHRMWSDLLKSPIINLEELLIH